MGNPSLDYYLTARPRREQKQGKRQKAKGKWQMAKVRVVRLRRAFLRPRFAR
jgi:hypothetical protein